MQGKFDGMYVNNIAYKHDERDEENQRKRESHKKFRYQKKMDGVNSTGNSESKKNLTLSSQMQSALYTDCVMYQPNITIIIGLYK